MINKLYMCPVAKMLKTHIWKNINNVFVYIINIYKIKWNKRFLFIVSFILNVCYHTHLICMSDFLFLYKMLYFDF